MNCIDLTSKRSKMLRYVLELQKWSNKWQWISSIWCQNDQNNDKLQTRSNYDEFASIWRQNYQKCWGKCKTFKTTQNYKVKKLQWIASIWCQNDQKTQNYKMNQITINLHRFDVKSIKNVEVRRKTFNTTQNYESDQIIMNCIDLTSEMLSYVVNLSKLRKIKK